MCFRIQPNASKLTGQRFIIQQANNPKHTAKATKELFRWRGGISSAGWVSYLISIQLSINSACWSPDEKQRGPRTSERCRWLHWRQRGYHQGRCKLFAHVCESKSLGTHWLQNTFWKISNMKILSDLMFICLVLIIQTLNCMGNNPQMALSILE